jgi:hypothetical protein
MFLGSIQIYLKPFIQVHKIGCLQHNINMCYGRVPGTNTAHPHSQILSSNKVAFTQNLTRNCRSLLGDRNEDCRFPDTPIVDRFS